MPHPQATRKSRACCSTYRDSPTFTAGYGKSNEMNVAPGDVICITSRKSSVQDFGIQERVACDPDEEANENFLFGIPAYHIREFFRMGGNIDGPGRLYVMFADCSQNWDALDVMQRAADGLISQVGIWTEQPLWKLNGEQEKYNLNLVKGINDKAVALAELNQPLSVVLCANPGNTGSDTEEAKVIDLNRIPSAICESSRTSVIFGQARNDQNATIQSRNPNHTPVGFLGAVMGALAKASVHESIAWVRQFNLFADDFQQIELGFEILRSMPRTNSYRPTCTNPSRRYCWTNWMTRDTFFPSSIRVGRMAFTSPKTRPAPTGTTVPSPATVP